MNASLPCVTIVGAGIAGMSAALRLLKAGCSVSIIERSDHVGGQFGAVRQDYRYNEHSYHIFADWCRNFFELCTDIGLKHPPASLDDKDAAFAPQPAFLTLEPLRRSRDTYRAKRMPRGRPSDDFSRLEYLGASEYFWKNANAGVAHWSDMFLYQYSVLDLLSDDTLTDESKEFLNRVSVNGFMHSREYASDMSALLHHELLLKVFAVPSYRTSARAYQTYLRHAAAYPPGERVPSDSPMLSPSFWAMRGNVHQTFWEPFLERLEGLQPGITTKGPKRIRYSTEVTGLRLGPSPDGRKKIVTHIVVGEKPEPVDRVLLAVPPAALEKILRNTPELAQEVPDLADVCYIDAVPVPALNLYFKRALDLPAEHMTLLDSKDEFYDPDASLARKNGIASRYGLSILDHSRLWRQLPSDRTVLSVLATDGRGLMSHDDRTIKRLVLDTLREYINFEGDDLDLDEDVHLQSHRDEPLFVNTEGSWEYRPEARLDDGARTFPRVTDKVTNLALAGDYCRSVVDIVSVEGAIVTGICAAHLLCSEVKPPPPMKEFDRERIRRSKALVHGWLDVVARRSRRYAKDRSKDFRAKRATQS
jgi:flavin-dependent amine oxidoreductase